MATFTLEEVLQATGGTVQGVSCDWCCDGVSTDTRSIVPGNVFVALRGERMDGHEYVAQAFAQGAVAAIVDTIPDVPGSYVVVKNTLTAYQDLARFHRRRFSIPVIAITGSSGKTTTKEMVAAVLETSMCVLKTEKNFNNEIGLPMTLLQLGPEHEACVVEMGMRGLGQIAELADIAEPTMGVVTNVGTSHIELLGSREGIAQAKAELITMLGPDAYAILNFDDAYVAAMKDQTKAKVMTYGLEPGATFSAIQTHYKRDGISFSVRAYQRIFDVFLPMIGIHNVYDALAALAVGSVLSVSDAKMVRALAHFAGIPMRQQIMNLGDIVVLNDAYNANPNSMEEAITSLKQLEGKRRIAVVGDMLELGDYSEQEHRRMGALLASEGYTAVYAYGPACKFLVEEALAYGVPVGMHFDTHEALVDAYWAAHEIGDSVLVKGSRGMRMETVAQLLEHMVK